MAHSRSHNLASGTVKLSQDIATLINNHHGSDIQFKVGGNNTTVQENGETVYNESASVTIYAHSIILRCRSRYFAAMFDDKEQSKKSSKRVIYKPNISPSTFQDVLCYIYTGSTRAKVTENIIELIAAAEEMELEELSIECQAEFIRVAKISLNNGANNDDENEINETLEELTEKRLPVDMAIRTLIIPALKLADSHNISPFLQQIISVLLPRMAVITASPDAYAALIDGISSQALAKLLASDNLMMKEDDVWDFALSWGCHHTNLDKNAVKAHLSYTENDEDYNVGSLDEVTSSGGDDGLKEQAQKNANRSFVSITITQLEQLKTKLTPLLPTIRFSLLEPEDYADMADILSYFLSRRRSSDLQRFFIKPNYTKQLDAPRIGTARQGISSKITTDSKAWRLLSERIFKTGEITGCSSLEHLKFELLFRASEHDFRTSAFHKHCDNKGPTLTLAKSKDGHLFGGINFDNWNSNGNDSLNTLNFLFSLADGYHRKNSAIFRLSSSSHPYLSMKSSRAPSVHSGYYQPRGFFSSILFAEMNQAKPIPDDYTNTSRAPSIPTSYSSCGPSFGASSSGFDLYIADCANKNQNSSSNLPYLYNGVGASKTVLAGAENFIVLDYEVFAISKK